MGRTLFLGAPIMTSGDVCGWLYFMNNKLGAEAFSEEDEQLTITLAIQVALAYENARRYDAIAHHAAQLEQEVVRRKRAEHELRQVKAELEGRVAERTVALQDANEKLATRAHQVEQRHREVMLLNELGHLSCRAVALLRKRTRSSRSAVSVYFSPIRVHCMSSELHGPSSRRLLSGVSPLWVRPYLHQTSAGRCGAGACMR